MRVFATRSRALPDSGHAQRFNRTPAVRHILRGPHVQPKLKIGAVDDPAEREADRVADQVMRMPDAALAATVAGPARTVQRACAECEGEMRHVAGDRLQRMQEEREEPVQAKERPGHQPTITPDAEQAIADLNEGRSLSPAERGFFEPRFGRSFESVRVHTGQGADTAARAVNARAFALGDDIAFANGEYSPGSPDGQRLLAHELAHTVQQGMQSKSIQRTDWGLLGGRGCNESPDGAEWVLVDDPGVWRQLDSGDCTGTFEDCDGMTCGGGFYAISNLVRGTCRTPRQDSGYFAKRRWTPTSHGSEARSPRERGSSQGDTPPGYVYDK
jgi:hypothetical protein